MQRLDAGACLDRGMASGLKEAVWLWESKCRGDGAMVRGTRERRRFVPGMTVNFDHVEGSSEHEPWGVMCSPWGVMCSPWVLRSRASSRMRWCASSLSMLVSVE